MKTIHAFQQRAEAKREARHRQLPPHLAVLLFVSMALHAVCAHPPAPAVSDELRAAQLLESALFVRQAGKDELRKMEQVYAGLVAKYPKDAQVRNAYGEFLWSMGEHARGVEVWIAAEKIDPSNAIVLDHLGGSFLEAGQVKKAASYYARATASAPERAAYHYNYANVAFFFRHELLDATRPDAAAMLRDALAHFREAARLDPINAEYARAYAETFYTVPGPDWQAALAAWQHFYQIAPGKDFALVNLARIHLHLGNKPEARESLTKVQSPEFSRLKARLMEKVEFD